ncbi:MAG: hypothetical protein ABIH18_03930 [Candidatus Omnitrophota bacterium]
MDLIFLSAIFITGLSGIIAQIILLRELLINFLGSELTLGIILANWLISEALGVFIFGKIIDKVKNKITVFISLQIIFSISLALCVYLSRIFKNILGVLPGETLILPVIFYSSFLIIFLPAFCHAALFSCGCKIYSVNKNEQGRNYSISRIYALETAGTIIGGILLTYLFLPYLNSFQTIFLISITNLAICLAIIKYSPNKLLKYFIILFTAIFVFLLLSPAARNIQKYSLTQQFRKKNIISYKNSRYGNITLTKKENQYTLFYNGMPLESLPFSDITFNEEFGHLPLLFQDNPKNILLIGKGIGGLLKEILKHPVKKIDYIELDSQIINSLKKINIDLIKQELNNQKVHTFYQDSRFFVKNTKNKYDSILIGLSCPSDLSTNRQFTKEFFIIAKERLNDKGILAFYLPGSLTYIGPELREINGCMLNTLKKVFPYTLVIPGDYNIFLASNTSKNLNTTAGEIAKKISDLNIETNLLTPEYINYRLNSNYYNWFKQAMANSTSKINQDTKPYMVFQMLIYLNKQFSQKTADTLNYLKNINLKHIIFLTLLLTLILLTISKRYKNIAIPYTILTTGFFGMLMSLILIFSFQIIYGYLYYLLGLLISVFMAGACAGSIIAGYFNKKDKSCLNLIFFSELLILIFVCFIIFFINKLGEFANFPYVFFIILFFIPGLLTGFEFPLAGKIFLGQKEKVGEVSGLLYFSDLLGGCLAGISGGVLLLPVLGLINTCLVIVILKLSSLILLFRYKNYSLN